MLWILIALLLGELVMCGIFALCLFLDWFLRFLKVHFQKEEDR